MWHIVLIVWNWFSANEWLAIWLEGIALVALFILEYRDSRGTRAEMLEQLNIAKQQAEAAKLTAESIKNSERAWLSASLRWTSGHGRILFSEDGDGGNQKTQARFNFKLKNDGRTPAWVESVTSIMDIPGHETTEVNAMAMIYFEPLGAGAEQEVPLTLNCSGKPQTENGEMLRVRITVNHRDIFEKKTMPLEFLINPVTHTIQRFETIMIPNVTVP
jgi:hypothetical protein